MNVIKIGILGTANIAKRSVAPAIKSLTKEFVLEAVASRNKDKANEFAKEFGIKYFDDYDKMINKSVVDALYIPLPNSLHFKWAKIALERGIHILVEKSLACTYEEVEELCRLAKENGLAIVENFQFRFHSQLSVIQDLINKNRIGELRCVRASFGFPPFPDAENIRYKKDLGGGALLDAGAYPLKISKILLGDDIFVSAAKKNNSQNSDVDIWGGGMIEQRNGSLFSEFAFGFDNFYQCSLEIWGNKGKITTNRIFTAPPNFTTEVFVETADEKETLKIEPCNHFENMLLHFYNTCFSNEMREEEYNDNLIQARLLNEFKIISNEKK